MASWPLIELKTFWNILKMSGLILLKTKYVFIKTSVFNLNLFSSKHHDKQPNMYCWCWELYWNQWLYLLNCKVLRSVKKTPHLPAWVLCFKIFYWIQPSEKLLPGLVQKDAVDCFPLGARRCDSEREWCFYRGESDHGQTLSVAPSRRNILQSNSGSWM